MKKLFIILFAILNMGVTHINRAKKEKVVNFVVNIRESKIQERIEIISNKLHINANDLCRLIQHESGFNTKALNPYTNAVGLIQFMPSTLKWLGYTTSQVYNMTIEQQLIIVLKYFSKSSYRLSSYDKLSLFCFYPYALRVYSNDNYIFGSEKSLEFANKIAKQNKGFDINKDGFVTMQEYKVYHQ